MTLQHRHFFPGYEGPASSNEKWWHDASMKHTKYPTAHDGEILETREWTVKSRGPNNGAAAKAAKLAYDMEVYGVVTHEAAKKAFDTAIYAEAEEKIPSFSEQLAIGAAIVKEAEAVVAKGNLPRSAKVA